MNHFGKLNRSLVKLASEDLLPEPDRLVMNLGEGLSPNPNAPSDDPDHIYHWENGEYKRLSGLALINAIVSSKSKF